jgi:radical SAM family uncharacterized protein/radical SAM-linked protein
MSQVEKPSRYLGTEKNTVRKPPSSVRLRFALAFPDLYEIGTSHFGMQILYDILNRQPEIAAERVYAPADDLADKLRSTGEELFALESREPLRSFDIIGFSLLYELNYTNVLTMLDLAGIPFRSALRDETLPLIIAGGPCTTNPEPVAEFFDAFVIGDGEEVVLEMARDWLAWRADGGQDKTVLLKHWSRHEGVYAPAFFKARLNAEGFQTRVPLQPAPPRVVRAIAADLDGLPFPDKPIIPYGRPVHDRLRLEIARGCTRGCRFCQAGMIYRPVRERAASRLATLAEKSLTATGYADLSLLSLSSGDYGCIGALMTHLMDSYAARNIAVSLPSLRAGTLSPDLMQLIQRVRKTGFTFAVEAGSQRLRDVINKNVDEEEIEHTIRNAFKLGWHLIKLYFMIGLPTETEADRESLVNLVRRLRRMRPSGRRMGQINVSVATFIPKPHTPFQWASQMPLEASREALHRLQLRLKMGGIHFKWHHPEHSYLEGIWARGDRRLGRLLESAYREGCRFDGWSDQFRFDLWMKACDAAGVDPEDYTTRQRDVSEPLPWDHIDIRVKKEFLADEWRKALGASPTEDCRKGECQQCGVCDFDRIEPRIHRDCDFDPIPPGRLSETAGFRFQKLQVTYAKMGEARYFGHLEMVNLFLRALQRADIPLKYSQGFHPKPRVSFSNPLPIGMESEAEYFSLSVPEDVRPHRLADLLNAELPEGLRVIACVPSSAKGSPAASQPISYRVEIFEGQLQPQKLAVFKTAPRFDLTVRSAKGKLKKFDLKAMLIHIEMLGARKLLMTLRNEPGKTLRPMEVLRRIFSLPEHQLRQARFIKLKSAVDRGQPG